MTLQVTNPKTGNSTDFRKDIATDWEGTLAASSNKAEPEFSLQLNGYDAKFFFEKGDDDAQAQVWSVPMQKLALLCDLSFTLKHATSF